MHGVYVLGSLKDGKLYTGSSHDIKARLVAHKAGRVPATVERRPLVLLYCELHASRNDAVQRERYFKTGWGRNYLEKSNPRSFKSISFKI